MFVFLFFVVGLDIQQKFSVYFSAAKTFGSETPSSLADTHTEKRLQHSAVKPPSANQKENIYTVNAQGSINYLTTLLLQFCNLNMKLCECQFSILAPAFLFLKFYTFLDSYIQFNSKILHTISAHLQYICTLWDILAFYISAHWGEECYGCWFL